MKRKCDECGKSYEAKSTRSRMCSSTCRRRKHDRSKAGNVVQLPVQVASAAPKKAGAAQGGAVERATLARLQSVEREDSPLGAAALILARRLDIAYTVETGSALAALAKQLEATLTSATKDVSTGPSLQEQLAAIRAARA